MAWTTTGTVSVTNNSAIVYGAGTSWASSNLVRGGDIFKAPDGKDYQVLSVQSNTQLTLATAYLGVTASAQSYALIHTGLLPAELAVGVSDLQSKYLTTVAQLYEWETSTAPTVPLTNPATNVTIDVKPIAGLIADIDVAKTASGTSNTPAGNISATTVQAAINELDAEIGTKAPSNNPTLTGKTVSSGSFGGGYAAQFTATAPSGTLGQLAGYSFRSTFGSGADTGSRRSADIWSGFDGGVWGTEYLAFGVGGSDNTGKVSNERMRLKGNVLAVGTATIPTWHPDVSGLMVRNAHLWNNGTTAGVGRNITYGPAYALTYTESSYAEGITFSGDGIGGIQFNVALSGTAGAPCSIKRAMEIKPNGSTRVGPAATDAPLSIKCTAQSWGGGFCLEDSVTTSNWQMVFGGDSSLYLGFNQVNRGGFNSSTGAYTALSDARLKKNIVDSVYGIDEILRLRPVQYNMKSDDDSAQIHLGFLAQEAREVIPSSVSEFTDGTLGMDKGEIVAVLVKAIQEQQAMISLLQSRISILEQK